MSRFTALDDPLVDERVEDHLERVVAALRARMEPDAIILRGSFGRGEGSVVAQNGKLRFLSDYEIDVASVSPMYRSLFRELSRQLTAELGVETSIRWVRPDYLLKNRVGPVPVGPAPITISIYESRYGSRTLYGQDLVASGPAIDPRDIQAESAAILMLNRMAESLSYMPWVESQAEDPWTAKHWINKTVLACAESLLLLCGRYHFSYAERGRRFATMAKEDLEFLGDGGRALSDMVAQATEFKLRPAPHLYPEPVTVAWKKVVPICEAVFRRVAMQALAIDIVNYSEFPQQFLRRATDAYHTLPHLHRGMITLLNLYKCVRVGRLPPALLSPFAISSAVYAVVPLMFVSWETRGERRSTLLVAIRRHLETVCRLEAPAPDVQMEWSALRQEVSWAWNNFCYR